MKTPVERRGCGAGRNLLKCRAPGLVSFRQWGSASLAYGDGTVAAAAMVCGPSWLCGRWAGSIAVAGCRQTLRIVWCPRRRKRNIGSWWPHQAPATVSGAALQPSPLWCRRHAFSECLIRRKTDARKHTHAHTHTSKHRPHPAAPVGLRRPRPWRRHHRQQPPPATPTTQGAAMPVLAGRRRRQSHHHRLRYRLDWQPVLLPKPPPLR